MRNNISVLIRGGVIMDGTFAGLKIVNAAGRYSCSTHSIVNAQQNLCVVKVIQV